MNHSSKQMLQERLISHKQRIEREKVVEFFLNLYNLQLKGPEQTHGSFRLINPIQNQAFTYELRINRSGKWLSRPMGIMPIGEETGKKSQCFKVIYDDVIVVKIPLNPIKDFERYIHIIRNERKVARKLLPDIECIAPEVSTVLKRIPSFFEGMFCVPEEIEDKCIERLKHFPKFQDYLKLDGGFVFFMDISRYSFLTQLLDNIFNLNKKIRQEITKHPEFISNVQKFEERYGFENTWVWLQMHQFYQDYRIEIDSLVIKHNLLEPVHDYKRRQWFLSYLVEKKIGPDDSGISANFFKELNFITSKLTSQYDTALRNYVKTVKAYVKKETFLQSKIRISAIVAGVLRLLALLKEKKVAFRDLKPDNIFVAGGSEKTLTWPAQRQDVFLGLIDLETAVSIDTSKTNKLEQPLSGGTPSYATPSNFVPNELLEKIFGNAARILHLQDWHASMGIIYLAVTGELLFESSKNLLYEHVTCFKKIQGNKVEFIALFKDKNRHFWYSAQNEFTKKIVEKEKLLKEIEVVISYEAGAMFQEELESLKIRSARRNQWIETLKNQTLKISAYNILIFMFEVITQTMYRKR